MVWTDLKVCHLVKSSPIPNDKIQTLPNLKEFAENNFKFDENGRKFSKSEENNAGNGEIACVRATSPFPTVFSKDLYFKHIKTRA